MARVRAPELFGRGGWVGAAPDLNLAAMAGHIVVLHFWAASCINCVRLMAELRGLEDRFRPEVVVVGIHSPKFPREHEHDAVQRAVERLGIRHPVLDDPDLATWQQYGVKGWPTLVLIDPEGYVVGGISGEGSTPVLASSIEQLISEHDSRGTLQRGPVEGVWGSTTLSSSFRTLSYPAKVDVDAAGRRIAIADTGNDRVIVCDLQGRVEQVHPLLTRPHGVRFDGERILVADTGADRVVAIDRARGEQTVLAEGIASPWDLTVLTDGAILVAEAGRHRLWRVPAGGGPPALVAGTGQENLVDSVEGGPALLAQPSGVAALAGGGAVFVDAESSALRVLGADGTVTTIVGQGLFDWGASDGGPDAAAMQHPLGVAVGPADGGGPPVVGGQPVDAGDLSVVGGQPVDAGDLSVVGGQPVVYVADSYNGMIRAWAGSAWTAAAGSLRTLPVEGLEEPGGLAVLPDGRLVIADTNHHRIVIVEPDATDPVPVVLDESWIGTATAEPLHAGSGEPIRLPYAFEADRFSLDPSDGPAVRLEVSSEPGTLLAPGPRRWALDEPNGEVELHAGAPGEGVLVVELAVSACDDQTSTVLRTRSRHDLVVSSPADVTAPDDATAPGAPASAVSRAGR